MKLVSRVSFFFLAALAMILLGNSLLIYGAARGYLTERFDEQLETALQTLVAAVEVEDDDVKWEPSDHTVMFGADRGGDEIRWIVVGDEGRVLDQSRNLTSSDAAWLMARQSTSAGDRANWKFLQQDLSAPNPKPLIERTPLEQSHVTIVVARDFARLWGLLRLLALVLVVLPILCWLVAAVLGRWFVGRAIDPVRKMAQDLRQIRSDDIQARLTVTETNDELQELAQSFNELLDTIFLAYERQRQFAADAAHQLRTPLTILQGHAELALRRTRSSEEYRETLSIVQDEVLRLNRTVDTLLRLARPDEESKLTPMQEVDLCEWLHQDLTKWSCHARRTDIQANCESPLICETRPDLLEQILEILMTNAMKYSPPGSEIRVYGFRSGSECVLEVADRGQGIATEDLSAIFDPFYRTRAARHSGERGEGLGLALARRLAGSLNARLECESQPGKGSTFRVRLPP
ncbi:ATP-binding protein [Schlesneria sp. DSM 10557]|uniref:sensor histidine kinase n=1 Tax=Schlesneria sp. DSM 10557 TaxID=3044399 RepID=UPI0035A1C11A